MKVIKFKNQAHKSCLNFEINIEKNKKNHPHPISNDMATIISHKEIGLKFFPKFQ